MQAIEIGDPELERRFAAFARARLSPDPAAIARIRARVMREARLEHEAARIAAHVTPVVEAGRRITFRRVAMPLLAATVWFGIAVGTVAAAQAGGALYPARLWVERATLPAAGSARVDADLHQLDDRISEALAAANRSDRTAVAAALDAYAVTADDATASSAADEALVARVQDALGRHGAVLTALVAGLSDKGNDTAAGAIEQNIERAIEHNAAVIDTLTTHQGGGASNGQGSGAGGVNAGGGGTDGSNAGGGGGGSDGSNAGGNGHPSPDATAPDKPDHTPRGGG